MEKKAANGDAVSPSPCFSSLLVRVQDAPLFSACETHRSSQRARRTALLGVRDAPLFSACETHRFSACETHRAERQVLHSSSGTPPPMRARSSCLTFSAL